MEQDALAKALDHNVSMSQRLAPFRASPISLPPARQSTGWGDSSESSDSDTDEIMAPKRGQSKLATKLQLATKKITLTGKVARTSGLQKGRAELFKSFQSIEAWIGKECNSDVESTLLGDELKHSPRTQFLAQTETMHRLPRPLMGMGGPKNGLCLRGQQIGDGYAFAIAKRLEFSAIDSTQTVDLASNQLSSHGLDAIASPLLKSKVQLGALDLSDNRICHLKPASPLINLLKACTSLTRLNLSRSLVQATDADLAVLSNGLATNRSIQWLDLSHNKISSTGATEALRVVLEENPKLTSISLAWNGLCGRGACNIIQGVLASRTIATLDLSFNALGQGTVDGRALDREGECPTKALMQLFEEPDSKQLSHLDLSFNNFNAFACAALSKALRSNHTLYGLHIDGNEGWLDGQGFIHPEVTRKVGNDEQCDSGGEGPAGAAGAEVGGEKGGQGGQSSKKDKRAQGKKGGAAAKKGKGKKGKKGKGKKPSAEEVAQARQLLIERGGRRYREIMASSSREHIMGPELHHLASHAEVLQYSRAAMEAEVNERRAGGPNCWRRGGVHHDPMPRHERRRPRQCVGMCWMCDGWAQETFFVPVSRLLRVPGDRQQQPTAFKPQVEPSQLILRIHLSTDGYRPTDMHFVKGSDAKKSRVEPSFQLRRMLPPGRTRYYFSVVEKGEASEKELVDMRKKIEEMKLTETRAREAQQVYAGKAKGKGAKARKGVSDEEIEELLTKQLMEAGTMLPVSLVDGRCCWKSIGKTRVDSIMQQLNKQMGVSHR
jgi:Ran GTPase-activating protein (RanGAP) involved in mRNA processing and transport